MSSNPPKRGKPIEYPARQRAQLSRHHCHSYQDHHDARNLVKAATGTVYHTTSWIRNLLQKFEARVGYLVISISP